MKAKSGTPIIEHPCYDPAHKAGISRLHLPVAPRCNVQCRFCDRSFDCVNESRPGVTASLLSPVEASKRVDLARERLPNLGVVGIAGPGDPLANFPETVETFRLVHRGHPDLALCLATNGLGLPGRAAALAELGVSHLTITVNAIDPEASARIYDWCRIDGRARTGDEAAGLLLERQLRGLEEAAALGMTIKINTILVPGVNEAEAGPIARECAARGASFMNLIPLLPVRGTPLGGRGEPSMESVAAAREAAATFMPQLSHCSRCRADAAGLLGEDISLEEGAERAAIESYSPITRSVTVAVASREGLLINRHLGEAERLFVFRIDPSGEYDFLDARRTPGEGRGEARWEDLAALVSDCSMLLAAGVGAPPRLFLESKGMKVFVLEGLVDEALRAIASGRDLSFLRLRSGCGSGCSGGAKRGCGCA